jgi:predicted heme/steroid binding protein
MNARRNLAIGLYMVTFVTALAATVSSDGQPALKLASFFAATAFGFMWTHYIVDTIMPIDTGNSRHDWVYKTSRIMVLAAILLHPVLVNWYLLSSGLGVSPDSYIALLGASAWAVVLGWLALGAFLVFEVRNRYPQLHGAIMIFNICAMFMVLIHGFVVGMVIMHGWFWWVWLFYLATFTGVMIYRQLTSRPIQRGMLILTLVMAIASMTLAIVYKPHASMAERTNQSKSNQSSASGTGSIDTGKSKVITADELAAHNGLQGTACWVAVNKIVYDMTNSPEWSAGTHTPSGGEASCGRDLSEVIGRSPHGTRVLSGLPSVGVLQ